MKKLRTAVSVLIMVIAGIVGLYALNDGTNGAILFAMIAGIACVVYTLDNRDQ